jgi:amidase
MTGLESGSDIGGSIRNPAHFCGVYGHKPTYGIVPDQGHTLPGASAPPDIAVVGPLARSAEDLAMTLDITSGADVFRSPGWNLDLPRPTQKSLSEYRVALWPNEDSAPVSSEVSDRVQQLGDRLAKLGATVSDTARPDIDIDKGRDVYLSLLNGVMSAAIPDDVFSKLEAGAASLDPSDRSDGALSIRTATQRHRDWVRADHARARIRLAWRAFFEDFDIVLCPICPIPAFPHDHTPFQQRTLDVDGQTRPYGDLIFWAGLITVAHLPSTVFPTGPSREGLPIGLQAVGAEYRDHTCIDFARLVADEIGGFVPPPGYDD